MKRSATIKINSVHCEHTIPVRTAQKWFKRFKNEESSVDDKPRLGSTVNFNNDDVKIIVESESQLKVDQFVERLTSYHGIIFRHINKIGKVSSLGKWVRLEPSVSAASFLF